MELNFKKFEKKSQRLERRITVTGSNSFGFPSKFYQDNNIGKYKYVVLYYDEKEKAVGFNFTNDQDEEHKFKIIKSKQGYGGSLVARSFFKTYNIDSKIYRGRYEWEKKNIENIGSLYVIRLKERSQEQTSP